MNVFDSAAYIRARFILTALATLLIGFFKVNGKIRDGHGADRIVIFGPMFLAVPMAGFGMEHFVFSDSVAPIVPSWIPWHLFWVYLVGFCLIAGALSLVVEKYAPLSAALFGVMLVCFVLLIHVPNVIHVPGNRLLWAVAVRDLAFSVGALGFSII